MAIRRWGTGALRRWGIPHSPAPRVWRLGNWVALPPYRISSCAVGEMLARRPQLLGEFLALALSIARIAQFPIALRLGLEDGDIGRIASLYDHDHPLLGKSNSLFQSPIALWIREQRRYTSVPTAVQISTQGGTNQYPGRHKSVPMGTDLYFGDIHGNRSGKSCRSVCFYNIS